MNQCQKGKRGERLWRDVLKSHGFKARRGQQYSGSPDSPDVVSNVEGVHWEVKHTQKTSIHDWLDQATNDAGDDIPVVAWKKNHRRWVVCLDADDFLGILKSIPVGSIRLFKPSTSDTTPTDNKTSYK